MGRCCIDFTNEFESVDDFDNWIMGNKNIDCGMEIVVNRKLFGEIVMKYHSSHYRPTVEYPRHVMIWHGYNGIFYVVTEEK